MRRSRIDWRDIVDTIPPYFKDNGNSSPGKPLWPYIYNEHTRWVLEKAAFPHDWGYTYGRLPGSGTEDFSRHDWDLMFANFVIDNEGQKHAAIIGHVGLAIGGWHSWRRNWRMMMQMGDTTYERYVQRKLAEQAEF